MDSTLEAALRIVDASLVDNNSTAANGGTEVADKLDSALVSQIMSQCDAIGQDDELVAELEMLSVYEGYLRQDKAKVKNADLAHRQAVDATVATLEARKQQKHNNANGDALAPMLPTPSALTEINLKKASKNRARRERRRREAMAAAQGITLPPEAPEPPTPAPKRFVASPGFGEAVGPLEFMVDAKSGNVAMTRRPLSMQEWTLTLNAMANDLNTRFYSDPMWVENARNEFQRLGDLGTQQRTLKAQIARAGLLANKRDEQALVKLEAQRAHAFLDTQSNYYEYICARHTPLLTASYRLAKADMVLGTTCATFKPHKLMPVGCGDIHAAMLCNTERWPKRYHLLYALLTGENIVTLEDVRRREGVLNGDAKAHHLCWPRYQMASGFTLTANHTDADDVEILHVSIHKQHVLVAFCPLGRTELHVGVHSLARPSHTTTVVRFDHVAAVSEWRVATNGQFVAVAYNDGHSYRFPSVNKHEKDHGGDHHDGEEEEEKAAAEHVRLPPNKVEVWYLDTTTPLYCFPLSFEAAPSDGSDGCELFDAGAPAVITAMCFDVNMVAQNYLCLTTLDRRAITFELMAPTTATVTATDYLNRAHAHVAATFHQCSVAPSKEQELRFAEVNTRNTPSNSAREPPTWLHTNLGFESRLVVLTPNNFLLKTLVGFGKQPTITEHLASYDGLQLGTLPLIYQHGAGTVQSIATAGNLMLAHFVRENDIVLINMRDQTQIMALKGSASLGYSVPEGITEAAQFGVPDSDADRAKRAKELREALDNDPFKPQYYYQSTWASLARLVVLMSDGTLFVFEPKLDRRAPGKTPEQLAGEMFAAATATTTASSFSSSSSVATTTTTTATTEMAKDSADSMQH